MGDSISAFRNIFEVEISKDLIIMDNTTQFKWFDLYCVLVATPKCEEVFDEVKNHFVEKLRRIPKESKPPILFRAEAQELNKDGTKSIAFKITPIDIISDGQK